MALHLLADALIRVEHKLDAILRHIKPPGLGQKTGQPKHFVGAPCPACLAPIDYQVDVTHNIVVRKCLCSSGKQASVIPLVPVGDPNAAADPQRPGSSKPTDRGGRPQR